MANYRCQDGIVFKIFVKCVLILITFLCGVNMVFVCLSEHMAKVMWYVRLLVDLFALHFNTLFQSFGNELSKYKNAKAHHSGKALITSKIGCDSCISSGYGSSEIFSDYIKRDVSI